ncbi:hypothetical protein Glove_566g87 [Diversispora epigaea]|uniref:Uncharacterized protein n=1 Tax=Diversispora epigaea TaxID=1348612 RepID=A0A397GFU0_9GLOM|nr:hypothetical protein Glove_566g87 [Diversispora epigaea]
MRLFGKRWISFVYFTLLYLANRIIKKNIISRLVRLPILQVLRRFSTCKISTIYKLFEQSIHSQLVKEISNPKLLL